MPARLALLLVATLAAAVPALTAAQAPVSATVSSSDNAATGDSDSSPAVGSSINADTVSASMAAVEADTALPAETKERLLQQYQDVLANLERVTEYTAKAEEFRRAIDEAPAQAASIRARLDAARAADEPLATPPADADLVALERLLTREQAEVSTLQTRLSTLRQELEEGEARLPERRRRLAEVRQVLIEVEGELARAADERGEGRESQADLWALEARRDALRAEALMLDQRILSADARRTLQEARADEAAFELARAEARRGLLQTAVEQARRLEAEQVQAEAAAAQAATADAHPLVQAQAAANAALGETIQRLTARIEEAEAERKRLEEVSTRVKQDFQGAQARLDAAGLNRAMGRVLLDQREQLPDLRTLRRADAKRADAIAEATLDQLRLRDELRDLADTEADDIAQLTALTPAAAAAEVQAQLTEQIERRRDLLNLALAAEERYLRALAELEFVAEQLRETVGAFDAYLAERLLWVRSNAPIDEQPFAALPEATLWLLHPGHWAGLLGTLLQALAQPSRAWLGLVVVVLLLIRERALRQAIRATGEPLRRVSTDQFWYTLKGLGLTLLLATAWPLLLWLLGSTLAGAIDADDFSRAIGLGLTQVALPFYFLRAFRLLCIPRGVADRHFRWSAETLRRLRTSMDLAVYVLLPIGLVAAAIQQNPDPTHTATLGRLALVAFLLGFAALLAQVLHPTRGVLSGALAANPRGLANRLRNLWFPLLLAIPLTLAALALAGFQYTTGMLLQSLINQLWLALGLVVAQQAVVRWLMVTRRSLALRAAVERRAQRDSQRDAQAGRQRAGPALVSEAGPTVEEEVDLAALDNQTRRLVNGMVVVTAAAGLWLIWADLLPALNILDRFNLWYYSSEVDGAKQQVPVTLGDLGLILVIIVVTTAAARNLPALIEILLLKNTEVTAGGRYTVTTLTGYVISAVGALFVVGTLGLNWGQVQWLVAALGVGIGFGLQEIVANFISGLIILFERPVRVGDIVTVGDTTGMVTKIEIRATTIRNWDRQELLVPNKEFITGRLLNWTLSDEVNRITIPIGVDYGADTRVALGLLAAVAAEHPQVLDDPAPLISFEGFGDNALNLFLRCYLSTMDGRLGVITSLHQDIIDRFRAAGIGIAFPQRDVHLTTAAPLELVWRKAAAADGPAPGGAPGGAPGEAPGTPTPDAP